MFSKWEWAVWQQGRLSGWNRWTQQSSANASRRNAWCARSYNNTNQSVSFWMAQAYQTRRRQHYTIWQYRLKAISPGGHHLLPDQRQLQLFKKIKFWNCLESKRLLTMCIALCVTLFPSVWQFFPLFPQNYFFPWCTSLPHVFWQRQRERAVQCFLVKMLQGDGKNAWVVCWTTLGVLHSTRQSVWQCGSVAVCFPHSKLYYAHSCWHTETDPIQLGIHN